MLRIAALPLAQDFTRFATTQLHRPLQGLTQLLRSCSSLNQRNSYGPCRAYTSRTNLMDQQLKLHFLSGKVVATWFRIIATGPISLELFFPAFYTVKCRQKCSKITEKSWNFSEHLSAPAGAYLQVHLYL